MQSGTRKLGEDGAVRLCKESNRLPSTTLYLGEVRANGMDAARASIRVKFGLERTGDGVTDEVRELRVIEDAKPCVNVASDTLSSVRAGLDVVQPGWVDNGASAVGL